MDMGCYTLFYICQTDKQEKWLNEWKRVKTNSVNKHINNINKLNVAQLRNLIRELADLYPNSGIETFTAEQLREAILQKDLEVKKMFDDNLDALHIMKNCDQADTVLSYGLYMIHNGKIYREIGSKYSNGKPVFTDWFCDIFRIYDYEARACFNIDDCYSRLAEHNVVITDEQDEKLKRFWNTYPDSIICFG